MVLSVDVLSNSMSADLIPCSPCKLQAYLAGFVRRPSELSNKIDNMLRESLSLWIPGSPRQGLEILIEIAANPWAEKRKLESIGRVACEQLNLLAVYSNVTS